MTVLRLANGGVLALTTGAALSLVPVVPITLEDNSGVWAWDDGTVIDWG